MDDKTKLEERQLDWAAIAREKGLLEQPGEGLQFTLQAPLVKDVTLAQHSRLESFFYVSKVSFWKKDTPREGISVNDLAFPADVVVDYNILRHHPGAHGVFKFVYGITIVEFEDGAFDKLWSTLNKRATAMIRLLQARITQEKLPEEEDTVEEIDELLDEVREEREKDIAAAHQLLYGIPNSFVVEMEIWVDE